MISKARVKTNGIGDAAAKPFVAFGVHPNIVSLFAVAFVLVYAYFALQQQYLLAFVFGLLALLNDMVDGAVARKSGKASLFGNYFETIIDKVVDFTLLAALVFVAPLAAALAMGFSFLASYAKPRVGLVIITDNRDWPGIGERGDKMAILLAGILIAAFYPTLSGFNVIEFALYLVALISAIGFVQRVLYGKKLIEEAEKEGKVLPYLRKDKGAHE